MKQSRLAAIAVGGVMVASTATIALPQLAEMASAHTGDLSSSAVCQDDGTYLVTYKLQLKNVPSGQTGHVYYRIGTTTFDGTPSNNTGMAKVGDFTGNPLVTIGTKTVAGTATQAPWGYAYTNWTPDNVKVGSDGGDIALGGTCKQKIQADATADVVVTPPTCDANGSAAVSSLHNATLDAPLAETPGTHSAGFHSVQGHSFVGGTSTTKSVPYTILAKDVTQHCFVQPPDNHRSHSTTPTCKDQVIVTTNEVQHFVWNGTAYVPGDWAVDSIVTTNVDLTEKCTIIKHVHVGMKKQDECNCFRDWVQFSHGPNVQVHVTHPTKLTWVAHATGRTVHRASGKVVQYLLPSKINGSHGWAKHQTYKVSTTNVPCPCHKTHTCHHVRPGSPPHCPTPGKLNGKPCHI